MLKSCKIQKGSVLRPGACSGSENIYAVRFLLFLAYFPKLKLNSVAFSQQANYTDRATAACQRS
jgi:hypothetical protein